MSTTAKIVIVVGGLSLVLLAVCGGGLYFLISSGKEMYEAEMKRAEFAYNWKAPSQDVDPEELFPQWVGNHRLDTFEDSGEMPEFDLDAEGWHGLYRSSAMNVNVYIYQVNEREQKTLMDRISKAIESGDYTTRSQIHIDDRLSFSVSPPSQSGYAWYNKGWMFFFHTTGNGDLDAFSTEYLTAIQPK